MCDTYNSHVKNAVEISIVVPAFNEAENIPLLVEATHTMMQDSGLSCELIVVDDGSRDNTYDVSQSLQKQHGFLKIVRHAHNRGITDALLSGFEKASGEIYVFYPADLQYDPKEIPRLVEPLRHGADIVTGWKTGRKRSANHAAPLRRMSTVRLIEPAPRGTTTKMKTQ